MTNTNPVGSVYPPKLKQKAKSKDEYEVIVLSIIAGLFAYLIDAVIDSFIFYDGPFLDQLIYAVPEAEVYFRSYILASFIMFGIVTSRILARRKKAEEALRESEERFRAITVSAKDAIIMTGSEGKISYWNPAAERMLGYAKEEAVGREMYKLVVPMRFHEGFLRGFGNFAKTTQSYTAGKPLELWAVRKDGTELPVEITVSTFEVRGKLYAVGIIRDITQRKKAEEELRRYSEYLRNIFSASPNAITVSDLNGNINDCNQATLDLLGFSSKEELIGKSGFPLIAKKDHQKAAEYLKKTIEQGSVKNAEYTFLTKDGREVPTEVSASIIRDPSGNITGFVSIARDITERKEAEKAVRESQRKFERLFMSNPEATVFSDVDDRVLDINPRFSELFGYCPEEAKGQFLDDLIVPDDLKEEAKSLTAIKEGYVYHDTIRKKKDGSLIPVSISSSSMISEDQNLGNVVQYKDITERRRMEEKLMQYSEHLEELVQKRTEELLESEKRYSVLVEEASDGVVIIRDGKHVFANKKFQEIAGYSRDEIIGLPLEKLIAEKYLPLVKERDMRVIRGEKVPPRIEVELKTKTEEHVPVEASSTLVQYMDSPAALVIVRNIKERKRMEETRQRLEKLAAIGELATMVGHDLRNPLQSIENATYYLRNELALKPLSSVQKHEKEMLQVIEDSISYADKIIRDLQDFSSIKKPTLKKTDINTIVKEALNQVKTSEKVEFRTELNLLPEIEADEDQMKRVFLNLIANGMQAMENGGRLVVSTKKSADFVEVSFRDTGVGIPKENMDKIFKPLFTTKAKGMGMGLAICKKFVESHSGSIQVESEAGRGTTFTVKLPIQHEMEVTTIARE